MAVGRTLPVSETIWLDSKIRKLQNSDKFLFLYLLTNSHVEYVGIYELTNETIKYETFLNDKNIISGLERLKKPYHIENDKIIEDCLKKINISQKEFDEIMKLPLKTFMDYNTSYNMIKLLKYPIKIASLLNIVPNITYKKYFEF